MKNNLISLFLLCSVLIARATGVISNPTSDWNFQTGQASNWTFQASTFSGTYSGLDNGITNSAGLTIPQVAQSVSQPPSATLTNIVALLQAKQPANTTLTNISALPTPFTGIVTNLVSASVSNRVYYSSGIVTNVTQP